MYVYIKIGKREFTFGNDRKGMDRRKRDAPVEDEQRKGCERRRNKPHSEQGGEDEKEKEESR
jgi:hypothetical protein